MDFHTMITASRSQQNERDLQFLHTFALSICILQ